jgi:hypothetical protein
MTRVEAEGGLRMAMVQFVVLHDQRRANLGLRVLAESLGVNDEKFLTIAAEVIHAIT